VRFCLGILAVLGELQIGNTVITQCYRGVKQPAVGCSFTVLKLKGHFKECLELQRSRRLLRRVLDKLAVLNYEELGGLSDAGPRDCVHNVV
jgi:hypothetical protein